MALIKTFEARFSAWTIAPASKKEERKAEFQVVCSLFKKLLSEQHTNAQSLQSKLVHKYSGIYDLVRGQAELLKKEKGRAQRRDNPLKPLDLHSLRVRWEEATTLVETMHQAFENLLGADAEVTRDYALLLETLQGANWHAMLEHAIENDYASLVRQQTSIEKNLLFQGKVDVLVNATSALVAAAAQALHDIEARINHEPQLDVLKPLMNTVHFLVENKKLMN
jgi:hypothetical protein